MKKARAQRVNWRELSPGAMAERSVFNYLIREAGVQVVLLTKLKNHFLRPMADDNGEEFWEIDWEYILFKATEHQRTQFAEFYGKWREDIKDAKVLAEKRRVKR